MGQANWNFVFIRIEIKDNVFIIKECYLCLGFEIKELKIRCTTKKSIFIIIPGVVLCLPHARAETSEPDCRMVL